MDPDKVFDIIRDVGERFVFPEDLETFQVGDLYLILGDSTAFKKSDTFSSLFPTTTLTTSYPTVMTSTIVLTPTMSPASSMATVVVVYSKLTNYDKYTCMMYNTRIMHICTNITFNFFIVFIAHFIK